MPEKKNRVVITVALLLAAIALFLGLFVAQQRHKDMSAFQGTLLKKPRALKPFALTQTDGVLFNNARLQGHWTLMFFGFTRCGSICPITMHQLAKTYRLLEERGVKPLPQVVMVSVDPERDNLETLKRYVTAFNPHFYGARGDEPAIVALTKEMGIAYAKVTLKNDADKEHYDIEHTGTVMLLNPQGELNGFFTSPQLADALAKDYQLLVS